MHSEVTKPKAFSNYLRPPVKLTEMPENKLYTKLKSKDKILILITITRIIN